MPKIGLPPSKRPSGVAPASLRSRCAIIGCSVTTSRSPTRTSRRFPRTISANRLWLMANAISRRSSKNTKPGCLIPKADRKARSGSCSARVREQVASTYPGLKKTSSALAVLDVLLSLAEVAESQHFIRPRVDDGSVLAMREGRHPVVEVDALAAALLCPTTAFSIPRRIRSCSSPAPTWPASPPTCARLR